MAAHRTRYGYRDESKRYYIPKGKLTYNRELLCVCCRPFRCTSKHKQLVGRTALPNFIVSVAHDILLALHQNHPALIFSLNTTTSRLEHVPKRTLDLKTAMSNQSFSGFKESTTQQ
ncbi:hypothetical protein J6590_074689 [Homalodisca vitripennis]|nr:hypothetical protein J6590_074689 [Homalodisca vitripennis]